MGIDVLGAVAVLAAVVYWVGWEDYLRPYIRRLRSTSVKSLPDEPPPARRSRAANVRNLARSRSPRANAVERRSAVRPANDSSTPLDLPAGGPLVAGDVVSLSPKELTQLGVALRARGAGASIDAAIKAGWGLGKGGGPAYARARQLFDLAGGAAKTERGQLAPAGEAE